MRNAIKKAAGSSSGELGFDISKARLVRRGPSRSARFSLRALRQAAGKTQAQVAKASGLAQPEVSKLESAQDLDDRQLLTIRRYLSALGDELDLVAVSRHGHRIVVVPRPEQRESEAQVPVAFPRRGPTEDWIEARMHIAQARGLFRELGQRPGIPGSEAASDLLEALDAAVNAGRFDAIAEHARKLKFAADGKRPKRAGEVGPIAERVRDAVALRLRPFEKPDGTVIPAVKEPHDIATTLEIAAGNEGADVLFPRVGTFEERVARYEKIIARVLQERRNWAPQQLSTRVVDRCSAAARDANPLVDAKAEDLRLTPMGSPPPRKRRRLFDAEAKAGERRARRQASRD